MISSTLQREDIVDARWHMGSLGQEIRKIRQITSNVVQLLTEAAFAVDRNQWTRVAMFVTHQASPKSSTTQYQHPFVLHRDQPCTPVEVLGGSTTQRFGTKAFMPDATFDRIVGLVHRNKLRTSKDFEREIKWRPEFMSKYLPEILEIIGKYFTLDDDDHNSGPQCQATGDVGSSNPQPVGKQKRKETCGTCKADGHRASNKKCPRYTE
ncbi:hypothetical protein MPER_04971, partial [Moniliophthora perniciosa FA553]